MLNIAFLGQPTHHGENVAILLKSRGLEIHNLEDSPGYGVYGRTEFSSRGRNGVFSRAWQKARRTYSQLHGTFDEDYCAYLLKRVDDGEIDCILAYWGTNPLADIVFLKRYRPHIKIILNVLCHPMGINPTKISFQNFLMQRSASLIDGFVFPSEEMRTYFRKHCGLRAPSLVMPPYLSEAFSSVGQSSPQEKSPNLVFLGRMDWNAGQPSDNVEAALRCMMESGIHVFHCRSASKRPRHENQHEFEPVEMTQLRPFMARFDASLIVYNLEVCQRLDRFRNTVPDRLLSSVSSGIPIALPRTGYEACKEFLRDYRAVLEYDSPGELKEMLSDASFLQEMKSFAKMDRPLYFGENYIDNLVDFILRVHHSDFAASNHREDRRRQSSRFLWASH